MQDDMFWRSALCCFFGELGDKTFFITVLLAAWCPTWDRISCGASTNTYVLQLAVVGGAALALLARTTLISTGVRSETWVAGFSFIAFAWFTMFGALVRWQQSRLNKPEKETGAAAGSLLNPFESEAVLNKDDEPRWNNWASQNMTPSNGWNSLSYSSLPTTAPDPAAATHLESGSQQQSYGAVVSAKDDPSDSGREVLLVAFALLAGFATVFVSESADKSQTAYLNTGYQHGLHGLLSAMLGYIPATIIAGILGLIIESTLMDQRLLYTVQLGFFTMSFISFSQACLGLAAVAPAGTRIAFLTKYMRMPSS